MCIHIFALADWNVADVLWGSTLSPNVYWPVILRPTATASATLHWAERTSVTRERQGRPVPPMAIFLCSLTDHMNCLYTSHQTGFPAGENSNLTSKKYWDTTAPSVVQLYWGGQEDVLGKYVTITTFLSCFFFLFLSPFKVSDKSLTSKNIDPRQQKN